MIISSLKPLNASGVGKNLPCQYDVNARDGYKIAAACCLQQILQALLKFVLLFSDESKGTVLVFENFPKYPLLRRMTAQLVLCFGLFYLGFYPCPLQGYFLIKPNELFEY